MRCLCRLCLAIALCLSLNSHAQDVVSRASGFWDDAQTWDGGIVPSALTSAQITVLASHHVIVRDVRTADQLIVASGGSLSVAASGILQLRDGAGTDLLVSGHVDVEGGVDGGDGTSIGSSPATLSFLAGSLYRHHHSTMEGTLPQALWHEQAVVEIAGYTSVSLATSSGNWGQDFGSMIWNTPNLQSTFNLAGLLNRLKGDLIIQSTGLQRLLLSSLNGIDVLQIDGDLNLNGSASLELTNSSSGNFTLTTGGDVVINTTGVLSLANQGRGAIELGKDFSILAGTISESGTGTGEFLFTNASRHFFNRGPSGMNGVFSGRINYVISSDDTLDLGIAVLSPGVGTNNGNTLSVSGTLIAGSTDAGGAIQNNTTGGNVRTTVSQRVFSPGSRVIYNGTQPQFIGNAGVAANAETVIDNSAGVSMSSNVSLAGNLVLRSGSLMIGNSRTLTLSGDVMRIAGRIDSTPTSTLVIADSVAGNRMLDLSPSQLTLATFTIDRRAVGVSITLLSDIITAQLNLVAGVMVNNNNVTLTENGMISRWARASLTNAEVSVVGSGQYDVSYRTNSISGGPFAKVYSGIELPAAPEKLRSLIITTGQSLDTVVLTRDITINNLLDMNRGRFYVQHHTINFKGTVWSDDTGNFGQGTGTVVFSDSTSIQGSSNPVFNSITCLSGGFVRFVRNFSASGDIDFQSGSVVDASSVTMTLTGSTPQVINTNGATIGNITVSKSNQAYVQLQSALPLRGILRFNTPSSNIDFRSDGFLTLLSVVDTATTSFGNSMIYRLQNGNTVTGDVTVQRFMSGEGRIYRYLSSPVNNVSISGWKDDFSITGNFSDPSPVENICGTLINRWSPSLYYYDEGKGATTQSGYIAYPLPGTSSASSVLQQGRGYSAFIRQCTNPTVADLTGPINQLQISLPVTYTSGSPLSGWNLVGNPYPCTIDWDIAGAQGWIKTNISPSIAIRDNGGGGFYRYWDGDGDPADLVEGRIAPGQGFWVRAVGPNPVLAVREGVKVLQTATYHRERDTTSVLIVTLEHNHQVDKAYIKIRKGASNKLDSLDCPKLDNVAYDLATYSSDNAQLAINALEDFPCSGEMNLVCKDLESGSYRLQSIAKGVFQKYLLFIRDNLTGEEKGLDTRYTFQLTSPIAFDDKRFTLRWQPRPSLAQTISSANYSLCESDSVVVSLIDAEDGVAYELWEDTIRVSETLTIHAHDLSVGDHLLQVYATTACLKQRVGDSFVVTRSYPSLATWRDGEVCNEGKALLRATADGNAHVYWYTSREDQSPAAIDTVFQTPVISQSTEFFASAFLHGCESKRQSVVVSVISYDPVLLTREGSVLISSMSSGNEWYLDGEYLDGENGSELFATQPGLYSVKNSVQGCSTEALFPLADGNNSLALVYPNPVESILSMQASFDNLAIVELLDALGQPVAEIDLQAIGRKKIGIFDVTKLKAGLYFLRLVTVGRKEEILMVVKK
jgi:hypothetical protein